MGRVLVTGASGVLGSALLPRLLAAGYDVRALSRRGVPGGAGGGSERSGEPLTWVSGDLISGSGIAEAVRGVSVIVNCATAQRGDAIATGRLIGAVRTAGTRAHLIHLSVVGIDRIPLAYYRTKLTCERLVLDSGLPHTVLRATQFHALIVGMVQAQRRLPFVVVPSGTSFQPVDEHDVAARLVEHVEADPEGMAADLGGPEVLEAGAAARSVLAALGRRRPVMGVYVPGRVGHALREGANLTPGQACPGRTLTDYLAAYPPGRHNGRSTE